MQRIIKRIIKRIVAPLAILGHLPGSLSLSLPSAWSLGDGLSMEPPATISRQMMHTHYIQAVGGWLLVLSWLIVVCGSDCGELGSWQRPAVKN